MNHPDFIVCSFMENLIGLKWLKQAALSRDSFYGLLITHLLTLKKGPLWFAISFTITTGSGSIGIIDIQKPTTIAYCLYIYPSP